jgi:hypothetical protein
MKSSSGSLCRTQPANSGFRVRCGMRQPIPSGSIGGCAGVIATVPSAGDGHTNRPPTVPPQYLLEIAAPAAKHKKATPEPVLHQPPHSPAIAPASDAAIETAGRRSHRAGAPQSTPTSPAPAPPPQSAASAPPAGADAGCSIHAPLKCPRIPKPTLPLYPQPWPPHHAILRSTRGAPQQALTFIPRLNTEKKFSIDCVCISLRVRSSSEWYTLSCEANSRPGKQ